MIIRHNKDNENAEEHVHQVQSRQLNFYSGCRLYGRMH